MGHELELQAISAPSLLLDRLHARSFDPQLMQFVSYYYELRRERPADWSNFSQAAPERIPFVEALEQMLKDDPSIETRTCHLDRQYQWLHLSLRWSAASENDRVLADWAVSGEKPIVTEAVSTQGFKIMWNDPDTCELVSYWLSELDEATVRAACDVPELRSHHTYKIEQNPNAPLVLESVIRLFHNLKAFYADVTEAADGVLFIKD